MSWERVGRLFVGIGFLWMAIVLIVGLLGGLDKPSTWISLLGEVTQSELPRHVYLALTVLVVPIGMLAYLWDIMGDPVAAWVKAGAPGAFLALYLFFLLAAIPDVGKGPFLGMDSLLPLTGLETRLDATGSWFTRFLTLFALLAGIPAAIGAVLGVLSGGNTGARRR